MFIKNTKKILKSTLFSFFLLFSFYLNLEPSLVKAASVTDDVIVTLTVGSGITISAPSDVTMSPNIGLSSNSSIGQATWSVETNRATGYSLAVKASSSPALVSGVNSFADYTETTSDVPEVWSVASGAKEFGYSAYGNNTSTSTWGTSQSCGSAGIPAGAQKYLGFETVDRVIASLNTATPAPVNTTICFAAQQNGVFAPSGTYQATITATATEL